MSLAESAGEVIKALQNLIEVQRHYGPGPHPGTGTPQEVHGGGRISVALSPKERRGIRTIVASMKKDSVDREIAAARYETGFGEALYTTDGAVIYNDKDEFLKASMQQIAGNENETAFVVDDRGYVPYKTGLGSSNWMVGGPESIKIIDELMYAYRGSNAENRNPIFVHSHPLTIDNFTSPPSKADLRLGAYHGVLNQRIATETGYYEFIFSRTLSETEQEIWRQNVDIWIEDHPMSDELRDAAKNRGGKLPEKLRKEVWQRQKDSLEYVAQEMSDLFSFRFVPWKN